MGSSFGPKHAGGGKRDSAIAAVSYGDDGARSQKGLAFGFLPRQAPLGSFFLKEEFARETYTCQGGLQDR